MITIDLSGKWDVCLDREMHTLSPVNFPDSIILPDSTSNAGLGEVNTEIEYGCLTDMHKFEGYAWFRRYIDIPSEADGKCITLFLERTRMTAVYIDGRECRFGNSLCTPHRFRLNGLSVGTHELIIRVANVDYPTSGGHMTSRDTQTNWNGILGRIELQCFEAYPEAVYVFPDVERKSVAVRAEIVGADFGTAKLRVFDDDREYAAASASFSADGKLECVLPLLQDVPLWDEFSPKLLSLEIDTGSDSRTISFGMREMKSDGTRLLVNGRESFLRGKHDGLVFPKTGYAPTDVSDWLEVFSRAKEYGINHYRFHTCCPPEAAFTAADIMGIYMQPELPFWGTIPDEFGDEHNYLRDEGFRILREYSYHPSFVMMSMGNELWGSKERLNELIAGYRKVCPDKMYAGGSNNFQFVPCVLEQENFFSGVRLDRDSLIRGSYAMCDAPQGFVQTDEPNSVHNYDPLINMEKAAESRGGELLIQYGTEMKRVSVEDSGALKPDVPVISHEVGQYAMYPDFDEIEKYTGPVRHLAYDAYKKGLQETGLYSRWRDFFKASGKLAAQCYRLDIETALRSELMSGFQLLDIQDFPGQGVATVGILNTFLENKGHITSEEWRGFCSDTVVLASMQRFVFNCGEEILCGIFVSSTRPDFRPESVSWSVTAEGSEVAVGTSAVVKRGGRVSQFRTASFRINAERPVTAELTLRIDGTDIINRYPLYIYPEIDVEITEEYIRCAAGRVGITHDFELARNGGMLYIPEKSDSDLVGEYCTDFWCYGMFRSISESMNRPVPTGTLGLYIEEKSPLLSKFPTEYHTTPRWYNIVSHSHCAALEYSAADPDIWVIDNPERRSKLALLYRKDGVVCCTSRLWEIADKPEVKHFAASVAEYILKNS
ncbi:MAG: beta-galactosidase [Oscillospiraceae bacterium]